ncbi:MAG: LysM peptidoglycan-binding domain-containing protein [Acidobacteria bacterium]|nr:LysM peptidoglycan-binding domain-containing protein [Acidobacteriota bacterium]
MLQYRRRLIQAAGVCGLLLVSACSSRNVSTHTAAGKADPSPPPVVQVSTPEPLPSDSPLETIVEQPDPIELLVEQGWDLFKTGQTLFEGGEVQEARSYFQQALDTLKHSGFEFFLNPHLESAYYDLLGDIQELELQALVNPAEIQPLSLVSPHFEEIDDLNLFAIQVDPHLKELAGQDLLNTRFDIPVVLNDDVLRLLNFYQNRGREIMEEGLKRSGRYVPLFREIFREEGVPLDLVYMAHVESHFKPNAYSRAKARGLWQFMLGTGRVYGLRQDWWIDERSDIVKSTHAAAQHLRDLYERFENWDLAMAAYNVGSRRIDSVRRRYGKTLDYWTMVKRRLLPRETRSFVPSILAALIIFRNPERYGFWDEPDPPLQFETIDLNGQVDVRVVAEEIDVRVADLFALNPELRRGITPFHIDDYKLKVPLGKADLLEKRLANLPKDRKVQVRHHKVKRGETLGLIAQRYRSSVTAIAQVNRIRNVHRLREGQDLLIPLAGGYSAASSARSVEPTSQQLPATHIVRRGDSLSRIAVRYRVSIRDLLLWNNLEVDQIIHPGQRIRILDNSKSVAENSQKTGADR